MSFELAQAQYDAMQPPDAGWECDHPRCDTLVDEDDRFCPDHSHLDEDSEFYTGCTGSCPDDCAADHRGEE